MLKWFRPKQEKKTEMVEKKPRMFSTDYPEVSLPKEMRQEVADGLIRRKASQDVRHSYGTAMDENIQNLKANFAVNGYQIMSDAVFNWFASQTFIGYQACALLSQHWLIDKACTMPAEDSVRNDYELSINDGAEVSADICDAIRQYDVEFKIKSNLVEFVRMGRIFGIRIALFKIESSDPKYYEKPFNPDGITPGSYKGISQIDPYWLAPELDAAAAGDPSSIYFYEPTWWLINSKRVHRSHLVITRTGDVTDILKPTYYYGGVPVPQKIYERVYAAERTANEAPQLSLSKRTTILQVDLSQAMSDQAAFENKMKFFSYMRDNYGVKTIDIDDKFTQFDTSLADLDAVIMTQYQIVAAAADVPAVKLLGTSPKGFNATGEHEEANYHEKLESIQMTDLTPLLDRHHLLLMRSEIAPRFATEPFEVKVVWKALDSMTAKEEAEVNNLKAQAGATLVTSGAIDPEDERQRIINDPNSGYNGLEDRTVIESDPDETGFTNTDPQDIDNETN